MINFMLETNNSKQGSLRSGKAKRPGAHYKRKGKNSRGRRRLLLLLRTVLLLGFLGILWILYAQWQVHSVPHQTLPDKADVGIVLGASLRKDLPSPALQERLDHTLKLYREGRFTQVIVSGGLDHNGSKLTEAEGMRNYLVKQGIPVKNIWLEPEATSTYENLLFSKRIMEKQDFKSAIVITHNFHGSRSLDIAKTLEIPSVSISTTGSEALFLPYHEARETLAYMNWTLTKLEMKAGIKPIN
jgi:uncharacterized SAM-binding protein YcdF (DUF218 family)